MGWSERSSMNQRPLLRWVSAGIALSLLLPICGTIVSIYFLPQMRFEHLPVHSLMEAVGGVVAVAIAGILLAERSRKPHSVHFTWMASALIGMGVLDLFHAAVHPGNSFIWLHSTATFIGGLLFAGVWVPDRVLGQRGSVWLPLSVLATTVIFGVFSCLSTSLPSMASSDGEFTMLARGLNVSGGSGFLLAGAFFVSRFHRFADETDWLFAANTILFGAAGILFELSRFGTLPGGGGTSFG